MQPHYGLCVSLRVHYSAFFLLFLAVCTSSFDGFIEYNHHLFSGFLDFFFGDFWAFRFYEFHVLCIDTDCLLFWGWILLGFFSLLFYCCFCFNFRFLWFFCVIQFHIWFWFQLKNLLPVLRSSDFLEPFFIVQKGRAKLMSWLYLIGLKDEKQYQLFFYYWVSSLSLSFILKVPLSFVYFTHLCQKLDSPTMCPAGDFFLCWALPSSFHSCLWYTYLFVSCYAILSPWLLEVKTASEFSF